MSSLTDQIAADAARINADADILHDIVNGADDETVTTEGGPVKTVAKVIYDADVLLQEQAGNITDALALKTNLSASVLGWIYAAAYRLVSGTRNTDGALTSGSVVWPDDATGTFAATTLSTLFPGAIDAYTLTRVVGAVTTTYTQPAVTRDPTTGAVTAQPAITIS